MQEVKGRAIGRKFFSVADDNPGQSRLSTRRRDVAGVNPRFVGGYHSDLRRSHTSRTPIIELPINGTIELEQVDPARLPREVEPRPWYPTLYPSVEGGAVLLSHALDRAVIVERHNVEPSRLTRR